MGGRNPWRVSSFPLIFAILSEDSLGYTLGCVLVTIWFPFRLYVGFILVQCGAVRWQCFDSVLPMYWQCVGNILEMFRQCFDNVLAIVGNVFDYGCILLTWLSFVCQRFLMLFDAFLNLSVNIWEIRKCIEWREKPRSIQRKRIRKPDQLFIFLRPSLFFRILRVTLLRSVFEVF